MNEHKAQKVDVSSHRNKGVIISLLFVGTSVFLGINLGRIFWIGLVLLGVLGVVTWAIQIAIGFFTGHGKDRNRQISKDD